MNEVFFKSQSQEWETPRELFEIYNEKYHFTLDVCATKLNTKCELYYDKSIDGLSQKWEGICWMNPPYGREIGKWCQKAYEESQQEYNELVCGLLPSRTDTRWWHDYVMLAKEIIFLRGRLKFSQASSPAPFPSAIAIWRKK